MNMSQMTALTISNTPEYKVAKNGEEYIKIIAKDLEGKNIFPLFIYNDATETSPYKRAKKCNIKKGDTLNVNCLVSCKLKENGQFMVFFKVLEFELINLMPTKNPFEKFEK